MAVIGLGANVDSGGDMLLVEKGASKVLVIVAAKARDSSKGYYNVTDW